MKIKRLKHCRLDQMKFFYWDEPDDSSAAKDSTSGGSFLLSLLICSSNFSIDALSPANLSS